MLFSSWKNRTVCALLVETGQTHLLKAEGSVCKYSGVIQVQRRQTAYITLEILQLLDQTTVPPVNRSVAVFLCVRRAALSLCCFGLYVC